MVTLGNVSVLRTVDRASRARASQGINELPIPFASTCRVCES
jgi:hypothetical protein